MAIDPTLETALEAVNPLVFHAVEITLLSESPPQVLRLLNGSVADVTFSGKTFTASDPDYGTVSLPEPVEDGVSDEAPHLTLVLRPPSNAAAAALCSPDAQDSAVNVWFGVLDRNTGQPDGEPDLIHAGEIDLATRHIGRTDRAVEIDVGSVFDRMLEGDEGLRLSNASHTAIRPGERGFEMISEVERQLPWGADAPRPSVITSGVPSADGGGGLNVGGQYGIF